MQCASPSWRCRPTFNSLFEMHLAVKLYGDFVVEVETFNSLFEMHGGGVPQGRVREVHFQFSIRDAPDEGEVDAPPAVHSFNSLFEMPTCLASATTSSMRFSFNSLFEMLGVHYEVQ